MASRVIVKNLPKHATDGRLKEFFGAVGEVTDCRVQKTKDGRSRNFAFIGFRNDTEAKTAVKEFNRSFFDTSKISVEIAHAPGSDALARPWSKYAPGSSAYEKKTARKANKKDNSHRERGPDEGQGAHGKAGTRHVLAEPAGERRMARVNIKGTKVVRTANIKPTKAGVSDTRMHTEFESSDEETKEKKPPTRGESGPAFDEELDDLAYLKVKAKGAKTAEVQVEQVEMETPKKRSKGKKRSKQKEAEGISAATDADPAASEAAAVDAAAAADAAAAEEGEPEGSQNLEDLESTGRLYITNLPYGASEDEVRAHFETLGEVDSVVVCKDEDNLKSRGFGYVTYVFPECAVRALSELDLKSFQGRLLRLCAAKQKPDKPEKAEPKAKGGTSSYKRRLEERKKKVDAHLEHTWNLLYVSASSAADAASAQLGVAKSQLFGKDAENAAVTATLTETSIIQQTKTWLQREGIRVDAFKQKGTALTNSKAILPEDAKRREDTLIVKHLPAAASGAELRERFGRFGALVRCALAPSNTVAIVQFSDKGAAKHAFQKLAFSRYRHVPLYLEWAPEDVFTDGSAPAADDADAAAEEELDEESRGYLFVKNLNFSTTEEALKKAFRKVPGFRSAVIMRKKAAVTKKKGAVKEEEKNLSMGYGFLEFETAAQAQEVLKKKQGVLIDGHAVQLQLSQARGSKVMGNSNAKSSAKASGIKSSSICVRNVAFEATRKELYQLFGAYGTVTSCRLPKKSDYSGHRGFAFIDFASRAEAQAAFGALQHSHLYGRRLVIEPAEEKASDVLNVQMAAAQRQHNQIRASEAKKRRKSGVLNAPGEAASFEDALA
ncbi:unnamed protein product [Durusdinium trenchii]|uniref:RRM domain-containing protein n=2 Tax=Durusdinium trenchii TaxID=1381693 RepID=A0ABP0STV4_9DINO